MRRIGNRIYLGMSISVSQNEVRCQRDYAIPYVTKSGFIVYMIWSEIEII